MCLTCIFFSLYMSLTCFFFRVIWVWLVFFFHFIWVWLVFFFLFMSFDLGFFFLFIWVCVCIRFFPLWVGLRIRFFPLWEYESLTWVSLKVFWPALKIFSPAAGNKARLNLKRFWEKCPSSKAWTNLWTKAKSQKIVTQGYSALYNTPFSFKSSAWDLSPVAIEFGMCSERRVFLPPRRIETHGPKAYSCSPNAKPKVFIVAF